MDIPHRRDWFNIGAIVPLLGVLFTSSFGLFMGHLMSPQAKIWFIMATIVMAALVWFNAAKSQQRAREDRQRGKEDRERLDKIIKLLEKPGTTLEDVKRAAGILSITEEADITNFHGAVE